MKSTHSIIYILLLLNSYNNLFAAEPKESNVYIKNNHPNLQFECKLISNGTEINTVIYKDKYLGSLNNIHDIQIKRYGRIKGLGAQYYNYTPLLNECKKHTDENCILQIKLAPNFETWDISIAKPGTTIEHKTITRPIEYFPKAAENEAVADPRYILDLKEIYTAFQVTDNKKLAIEGIKKDQALNQTMKDSIIAMLDTAANYARKLLTVPQTSPEYQTLLVEFRGLLHPERIVHGQQVCCSVIQGTMPTLANSTEHLNDIIDIMWFLYYITKIKGQSFEEGTFVIQDNDLRIYNFLMSYVRRFYNAKGTLEDPADNVAKNSYAYPRISSHFLQEQSKYRHYGIDIRYPGNTIAQADLPANKAHILFGNLGNGYIFIKLENAGTAIQSSPQHAAEFIASQLRKMLPKVQPYLKTYVSIPLNDLLTYYIETDDDPTFRKERVPQEVIEKSREILGKVKLPHEQEARIATQFAQQGIHGIVNEIINPASPLTASQKQELRTYIKTLIAQGLDHVEVRYGREVIISHSRLETQCKEKINL